MLSCLRRFYRSGQLPIVVFLVEKKKALGSAEGYPMMSLRDFSHISNFSWIFGLLSVPEPAIESLKSSLSVISQSISSLIESEYGMT